MRRRIDSPFSLVAALAFALALATTTSSPVLAADAEFFFFSPQVGTGNLSQLKQVADRFLRESGASLTLQPFARFEDLEREFDRHKPAFLVAPEWVAMDYCVGQSLRPVARPVRDDQLVDRRALIAGDEAQSPADIDGGAIAATVPAGGTGAGSAALERFRREHPDVRVIPVPKDIDALLAVGFGQVDGAFVSMTQFDMLARVNPGLTGSLHEIGYSIATPFPAVYATEHADDDAVAALRAALGGADQSDSGRKLMRLLGYDGWQSAGADEPAIVAGDCTADAEAKP